MSIAKAGEEGSGIEVWGEEGCTSERLRVGEIVIPRVRRIGSSELDVISAADFLVHTCALT